ncbi:hypothetical protein LDENG_00289870 [Lucifuga dentata]|nr:hypothetical protein LDENG_00289870 [Lucifuga dentata]
MADTSDDHRFHCSVCLDLFTNPVSTPCGHNLCKICIKNYWDSTGVCSCPLCKEIYYKRPELRINVSFQEIVDLFKNKNAGMEMPGGGCEDKAGDVVCDICMGLKLKAAKSCLVCMVSYCKAHLEPHKTAAALS